MVLLVLSANRYYWLHVLPTPLVHNAEAAPQEPSVRLLVQEFHFVGVLLSRLSFAALHMLSLFTIQSWLSVVELAITQAKPSIYLFS